MLIKPDSLCRGVAANFPPPVDEEHKREAECLVVTVHEINCCIGDYPLRDIVYRGSSREEDIGRHVFRWDDAPYGEIFQNGIRVRRQQDTREKDYFNLSQWVFHGGRPLDSRRPSTHAFISTTLSTHWHPSLDRNTPVRELNRYEIYAPGGIWVAQTLGDRYQYSAQDEVCFVAGIAAKYIRSAQRFRLTYDGTRHTKRERVDTIICVNMNFNPHWNPRNDLIIQRPVFDYVSDDGSRAFLNIEFCGPYDKRQVSDPHLYNDNMANWESYIDAAFRSSRTNEAYIFMKNEYVLLNYAPGSKKDRVVNGPKLIRTGFPSLRGSAFAEHEINCAFGSSWEGEESAIIFSGNLCARINYAPHTTNGGIKKGPMTIIAMFPFLKGTVFESGVDAAFEFKKKPEAYLFKGNRYAHINYGPESHLFGHRLITQGFPSLRSTIFENGIDAAFASHRDNEAYMFKGDSYALINFASAITNDYIIGGVKKIHPNWPSLRNSFSCIDAAFRSSRKNQVYLFRKHKYVVLNYAPGSKKDWVVNGPKLIRTEFPSLKDTVFAEHGIDCAFGSAWEKDYAFIFYGNLCALINYAPGTTLDWIEEGPMTIAMMFPFLKGTVFESGVDAAFESTKEHEAYLFKGNQYALINYGTPDSHLIGHRLITQGFPSLRSTIFESGIDAAFASHRNNEAYIFKGDSYALINFAPASKNDYIIGGVKKILPNWPSLHSILPRKNRGLDVLVYNIKVGDNDNDSDRDHDHDRDSDEL